MHRPGQRPIRKSTARRLRALADRFEPRAVIRPRPGSAPLVRIGGRWWRRDELVGAAEAGDAAAPDS